MYIMGLVNIVFTISVGVLVLLSSRRQLKKRIRTGLGLTLAALKNSTEQLQRCLHDDLREGDMRRKAELTRDAITHVEAMLDSNCQTLERCHRSLLGYIKEYNKKYQVPD